MLTQCWCTLSIHSQDRCSSFIVDRSQVLTRLKVLKERIAVHVAASKVNDLKILLGIAGKKSLFDNKSVRLSVSWESTSAKWGYCLVDQKSYQFIASNWKLFMLQFWLMSTTFFLNWSRSRCPMFAGWMLKRWYWGVFSWEKWFVRDEMREWNTAHILLVVSSPRYWKSHDCCCVRFLHIDEEISSQCSELCNLTTFGNTSSLKCNSESWGWPRKM